MTGPVDISSSGDIHFLQEFVDKQKTEGVVDLGILQHVSSSLINIQKSMANRQITPKSRADLEALLEKTADKASQILKVVNRGRSTDPDLLMKENLIYNVQKQVTYCLEQLDVTPINEDTPPTSSSSSSKSHQASPPSSPPSSPKTSPISSPPSPGSPSPSFKSTMKKLDELQRFTTQLQEMPQDEKNLTKAQKSLAQFHEDLSFQRPPFDKATPEIMKDLKRIDENLRNAADSLKSKKGYRDATAKYERERMTDEDVSHPPRVLREQRQLLHEIENTRRGIADYIKYSKVK